MDVTYKHVMGEKPSKEQISRIKTASLQPVSFDEDSPELTAEQLTEMRKLAIIKRAARKKDVVAIRLDKESIGIAKNLGPGYTGIMGRILFKALRDPDYIKDCL